MTDLLKKIALPPDIETALDKGASLVISISGGKDSDAMCELLPLLHKSRGWTGKLALVHADLKGSDVSEVILGQILCAGQGQNPARQAAMKAGVPSVASSSDTRMGCPVSATSRP